MSTGLEMPLIKIADVPKSITVEWVSSIFFYIWKKFKMCNPIFLRKMDAKSPFTHQISAVTALTLTLTYHIEHPQYIEIFISNVYLWSLPVRLRLYVSVPNLLFREIIDVYYYRTAKIW
jgi:hypothetical protein